ncbi:ATP synthase subunit C [Bittarella massiliensis (ex Durand et al. 2017)]|uniref:ATP synthase subunit C n=1 Tax=Bittarella massiliensis (ex Durand et al. 2017) TaxID=1720313 RepID=UPI001AA0DE78|nr:ATP synthase subunit C [Bittarella massiliensis (ex Durand et al. 2017)]MBO1679987.1 hypothetical protein [Bittarella massiliensis (ex Durand et al. 2017)]
MDILLLTAATAAIAALFVYLFKARKAGKKAPSMMKKQLIAFGATCLGAVLLPVAGYAAEAPAAAASSAAGMAYLAAALVTGLACIGCGIAVAAAAPAAIGAVSENDKTFGKSLIFVAMGEGVAIYGLLISIMILNKV